MSPNMALFSRAYLPTSNSNPLSTKVCKQPPAWSCCSRTRTRFPARANKFAVVRPPIPLPITIASRRLGIFLGLKPVKKLQNIR